VILTINGPKDLSEHVLHTVQPYAETDQVGDHHHQDIADRTYTTNKAIIGLVPVLESMFQNHKSRW
jgi:hypothetical protein